MSTPSPLAQLPNNVITIRDGRVQSLHQYVLWNGEPSCTIEVLRLPDGTFMSNIGDPEHGGSQKCGTLEEVTTRLHQKFRDPIIAAFRHEAADADCLHNLGLRGYEITVT